MSDKQIILTVIKNCWPATIGFQQLVIIALKEHCITQINSERIINHCILMGEVSFVDNRIILEKPGYDYLNGMQAYDDAKSVTPPKNSGFEHNIVNTEKSGVNLEWTNPYFLTIVISGIISIIITIIFYEICAL